MNPEFTDTFILETQKTLANHEVRITTLEESVKDIKALTQATSELAFNQKAMNEKIDELTTNVQAIVDEPKKNWITIRTAIFSSIGGSVGTGVIAWLLSLLK